MVVAMTATLNTVASVLEKQQYLGPGEFCKTMVMMTEFIITFYSVAEPGSKMLWL